MRRTSKLYSPKEKALTRLRRVKASLVSFEAADEEAVGKAARSFYPIFGRKSSPKHPQVVVSLYRGRQP
jgi:hypothetical protein